MAKHAYLAASASERWLKCPPSAKLCAQEEDRGSPYAQQGTDAHELAAYLAEKALGRNPRDPTEGLTWYDAEMQEAAEGYAAFVWNRSRKPGSYAPTHWSALSRPWTSPNGSSMVSAPATA